MPNAMITRTGKTVAFDLLTERCLCCPFVATALSVGSLFMAMENHVEWINRYANHADDPHFEEIRLDNLIAR